MDKYQELHPTEFVLRTLFEALCLHPEYVDLSYIINSDDFQNSDINSDIFIEQLTKFGEVSKDEEEDILTFRLNQMGFCAANEYSDMLEYMTSMFNLEWE